MSGVDWWLVVVAFLLGAGLTTAFMLRRTTVRVVDPEPEKMSAGTKILLGIDEDEDEDRNDPS
jgi:hypothetical protein